MNFTALKAELASRGYDYLSDARQGQFINDAKDELDELYMWPYREASGTGVAPMTISDLGTIEQVSDETRHIPLQPMTFQWLSDAYGDLSTSGTPSYYYVAWPSGVPVVATYPTNTNTIGVQYWRITPTLTAGADTPLAPSRFHNVYVDIAVRMALRDSDNHQGAEALQVEIDRKVGRMVNALLGGQQAQGPADYTRIQNAEDAY